MASSLELIPTNIELRAVLTARKGALHKNPRVGKTMLFQFTLCERFSVLRAKNLVILQDKHFSKLLLDDEDIYFKASKGAPQHRYEIINNDSFTALLTQRVKRVSTKEKEAWAHDVFGNLRFEFFIYCRERDAAKPTIHRATAVRIRDATAAVQLFQEQTGVTLGPIAMYHAVTTHARQPDETPFAMPEDNTTRQAMALDASIATSASRQPENAKQHVATIPLEVNGNWTDFRVDVASVGEAFGLPPHDIFTQGIYHGFVPVEPPRQDMEDVGHREDDHADGECSLVV